MRDHYSTAGSVWTDSWLRFHHWDDKATLGSADATSGAAQFTAPLCLAIDSGRNLFVTDILNNTIRKLTPDGTNWVTTTIAGKAGVTGSADGTNSAVRFNNPNSIALDGGGDLFVTDQYNNTVGKLTPMGTNWVSSTIGGLVGHSGSADGTNSAARFTPTYGVAVDSAGNLYVGDGSSVIREGVPLPVFQSVTRANGHIGLTWSVNPGQKLQLQFTSNLTSTNWTNLGNAMTPTNGTGSASDTLGPG
jgi:sugar lactone lactonase YvrE